MRFRFGLGLFCAAASAICAAGPASACYDISGTINYDYRSLVEAQVIVRAVVRSYHVISRENLREDVQAYAVRQGVSISQGKPVEAILELDVLETIHGYPKRPSWSLRVSARGTMEWKWRKNVIVGIRPYVGDDGTSARVGAIEHWCYSGRFPEDTPDNVETVEATLLSIGREINVEEAAAWIRGQRKKPLDADGYCQSNGPHARPSRLNLTSVTL